MTSERVKVLYLNDNRVDCELVRDALSNDTSTYELTEVATLEEFEEALRSTEFHVVLSDYDICRSEGVQFLSCVNDLLVDVPVIIVTGTGSEEIAVDVIKAGATDYIVKSPTSIAKLPAAIDNAICCRRLGKEKAHAEQALQQSDARFKRAVVQAPVPIIIHADDGQVLTISDMWLTLTGYTRSELTTIDGWVQRAYGERSAEILEKIARTYEGTDPLDEGVFTVRCADGSERLWEFRSTPLGAMPDGRKCAISIASDVTEHRLIEAQLRQSEKLAAVGRLSGGIAHDFGNMLQVILGYGTIAIDALGPSEEVPNWLAMIMQATHRSTSLTRQILAFARTEPLDPTRVELEEALKSFVKLLSRVVEEHVELRCRISPDIWDVMIDPAQLDSIVANLVINARDAIVGVGSIDVEATNRVVSSDDSVDLLPGDYVTISVRDTGAGIVSEDQERVFEPFYTSKERGKGTGLGLPTVCGILRDNGGTISVESAAGSGSTFTAWLPRCVAVPSRDPLEQNHPAWSVSTGRILLVEDDEAVLRITEQLLTDLGYRVTATGDSEHALKLVREGIGAIDLVMTDVVMPNLDGPALVEKLRLHIPEVPVLFTSGYPAGSLSDHGVMAADIHFLPKPFSREKLAEKVAKAISTGSSGASDRSGEST